VEWHMRRQVYLIPLALAALVAGSSAASAQRYWDNPPGSAWQDRGNIDSNGYDPYEYRYRHYRYGGWNTGPYVEGGPYAYAGPTVVVPVPAFPYAYRYRRW